MREDVAKWIFAEVGEDALYVAEVADVHNLGENATSLERAPVAAFPPDILRAHLA